MYYPVRLAQLTNYEMCMHVIIALLAAYICCTRAECSCDLLLTTLKYPTSFPWTSISHHYAVAVLLIMQPILINISVIVSSTSSPLSLFNPSFTRCRKEFPTLEICRQSLCRYNSCMRSKCIHVIVSLSNVWFKYM